MSEDTQYTPDLRLFLETAEAAGHSIYITGRDGTIEYVNPAFERTTGYSAEEAVGQNPRILQSGAHDRRFYERLWDTILAGNVWRSEIINKRKDGTRYVAEQTIAPIENEDGEITNFVAINIDITERKERERELERFRNAVEYAGHGVLITDADGTIEYVNRAFEETTGYTAAEAVGETPAILNSGAHDEEFYADLWETILDGEVWQGEVINERKDGSRYVVDQTIAPIVNDGVVSGFVAINLDVTRLKKYRQELEAQNERLREYGHTVAHDLRNPLNVLSTKIDELRASLPDDDTAVDRCDDVAGVVDRMENLIDDLLTMAEQGQRVLDPTEVSLAAVASEAWEQAALSGEDPWQEAESGATLSAEDTGFSADRDRLRELLSNLFRNSVEHAGEDVEVRVGPLGFDEGFYVEDDGPGIPPGEREEVFERGVTTSEEGTGFGLAIVEQIAHAHEWTVSVTDGDLGGARFEFRFDGDDTEFSLAE
jgi:PAS domain S-box-containing protein